MTGASRPDQGRRINSNRRNSTTRGRPLSRTFLLAVCPHGCRKRYGLSLGETEAVGRAFGVPRLGFGTQVSKLKNQVRDSCPEAQCPQVQCRRFWIIPTPAE